MSIAEPLTTTKTGDVVTAPVFSDLLSTHKTDPGDHDKMAHIVVPASAALEAAVTGVPITALCGKTWVPNRDPENFPVCQGCIDAFEAGTGKKWMGPR